MPFDFTQALVSMRKVVHDTFAIPARYDDTRGSVGVGLSVRWHNKMTLQGNLTESGYADFIEGIDRVIFNREELIQKNVILRNAGTITLGPEWNNAVLSLEALEPADGPVNVIWKVSKS